MYGSLGKLVSFVFVEGNIRTRGKTKLFPSGPYINCILVSQKQTSQDGVWATTTQLYPGWDTFEFDQGHVTKNQPITVLCLLSESLAI